MVLTGVLAKDEYLSPIGSSTSILFKSGTEVSFAPSLSGKLLSGTLANDIYLYTIENAKTANLFKSGSKVTFDYSGKVIPNI
jgi:hypothetical protein